VRNIKLTNTTSISRKPNRNLETHPNPFYRW